MFGVNANVGNWIGRIPDDGKPVKIYPLPHSYVVRDLVPDLTHFYAQLKSIRPTLLRDTPSPDVRASFLPPRNPY